MLKKCKYINIYLLYSAFNVIMKYYSTKKGRKLSYITHILCVGCNNANNVIKYIEDWFDNNLLGLNLNKSKYIKFNINSEVISLELNICIHSSKCQSNNCHYSVF